MTAPVSATAFVLLLVFSTPAIARPGSQQPEGARLGEQPTNHWHVDAYNAENLNANGVGNQAMWCGVSADDPEATDWWCPPGYGDNWDDVLLYESGPLPDPSAGQTVLLEFFFNLETEAGFDVFTVEYDSAGTWTAVCEPLSGSSSTWEMSTARGTKFTSVQTRPISYAGGDYGGPFKDRVRIRLRFRSDDSWSNQDGMVCLEGSAVEVDDLTVLHTGGTSFENFEGEGPWLFDVPDHAVAAEPALPNLAPRLRVSPNPMNPVTTVRFLADASASGSVKVYTVRGELVRTLHAGTFRTTEFLWDGTDSRGLPVSSGVYLIRATDGESSETARVAVVK